MSKTKHLICVITTNLVMALSLLYSCQRPDPDPNPPTPNIPVTNITNSEKLVGEWVICDWRNYKDSIYNSKSGYDTLKFFQDGSFRFVESNAYGVDQHYYYDCLYDCSNHFLILYKNASAYTGSTYPIEYTEEDSLLTIYNWNIHSSIADYTLNIRIRKIN